MSENKDYLFNELMSSLSSGGESSSLNAVTNLKTGKTELVLKYSIKERYPVQDYEKVIDLYERLNCGGGRRVFTLEELAHPYNPK